MRALVGIVSKKSPTKGLKMASIADSSPIPMSCRQTNNNQIDNSSKPSRTFVTKPSTVLGCGDGIHFSFLYWLDKIYIGMAG